MCDVIDARSLFEQAADRRGVTRIVSVCREQRSAAIDHPHRQHAVTVVRLSPDPIDQQNAPVEMACLESCLGSATPEQRRAAIHQAIQHLAPRGWLMMSPQLEPVFGDLCAELGLLRRGEADACNLVGYQRSDRLTVHDLLWQARARIQRVDAPTLAAELAGARPPLVIDTRTGTDRARFGVIPGSIHVPRTVLEWHLDPANGYPHPGVTGLDQRLVVICNGGYSSSLAAANLVLLGFSQSGDLIGGMRSWIHHGLPVQPPDHAHLDLM